MRGTASLHNPLGIKATPVSSSDGDTISTKPLGPKAASDPAVPDVSVVEIKPQISAPSYLFSLKENDAPPFKVYVPEPKPKIVIGSFLDENEIADMIATMEFDKKYGLQKYLSRTLVEKKVIDNYALIEKRFLISLIKETIGYAEQRDFSAQKLAVLLSIYVRSHCYFKWYYWQAPAKLWNYFKDLMIRHTINDSPEGQDVFEPSECYDILTHFHAVYITNLPLIHILTFGSHRIKFLWPFKK